MLGIFAEGTRQLAGVPGPVQPGAAMAALQEDVPVVCAAIHGSQTWKVGNFAPVSIAWGEPMRFDGLPRGGKGYREASVEIERELHGCGSGSPTCTPPAARVRATPCRRAPPPSGALPSRFRSAPGAVRVVGFPGCRSGSALRSLAS